MNAVDALRADAGALSQSIGREVQVEEADGRLHAIIKKAMLPPGTYSKDESDVLLLADYQYPMSAMDMFFMEEAVVHIRIPLPEHAKTVESHLGRQWRRWSWHRPQNNPWKPGVDSLLSQWTLVEACWKTEAAQ